MKLSGTSRSASPEKIIASPPESPVSMAVDDSPPEKADKENKPTSPPPKVTRAGAIATPRGRGRGRGRPPRALRNRSESEPDFPAGPYLGGKFHSRIDLNV